MQGVAEQTNCLQGAKKPSGSVSRIYLKQAIRHYLYKADSAVCEKEGFAKLEIVRDLTRRLRRSAGFAWWVPVLFAAAMCILFLMWLIWHQPKGYSYAAPDNYFQVLDRYNDYDFLLQRIERGVAQPAMVYHFCRDYRPLFEPGMTLSWFSYDDRGECQSVAPGNRGYVIVRGSDHKPVITKGK